MKTNEKEITDFIWSLTRTLETLGYYLANHDFADANAEAGRLTDIIEDFQRNFSNP